MVNAILSGQKMQTRRLVKPEPWGVMRPRAGEEIWPCGFKYAPGSKTNGTPYKLTCPHGKVGDQLWVKETWAAGLCGDGLKPSELSEAFYNKYGGVWYKADGAGPPPGKPITPMGKTRQSIFMVRWASRIQLEITNIRVERLNDISEEDAQKEGVLPWEVGYTDYLDDRKFTLSAKESFKTLWQSINGAGSWKENPWVWVVEFNKL